MIIDRPQNVTTHTARFLIGRCRETWGGTFLCEILHFDINFMSVRRISCDFGTSQHYTFAKHCCYSYGLPVGSQEATRLPVPLLKGIGAHVRLACLVAPPITTLLARLPTDRLLSWVLPTDVCGLPFSSFAGGSCRCSTGGGPWCQAE